MKVDVKAFKREVDELITRWRDQARAYPDDLQLLIHVSCGLCGIKLTVPFSEIDDLRAALTAHLGLCPKKPELIVSAF